MGNHAAKHHYNQQHPENGKDRPKKFVHWKSAERPSAPGRPVLIPLSDQQPDVLTLRWDRPKSDGGSPISGYVVEHRRTGSPHWVRATPTLVVRTEVSISGLEPGWRYQFRVIAENVVGRSEPSELSDLLTVTLQRNAITVPRFVTELRDTTAVESERVELRVAIAGTPQPEISWYKDGYEMYSSRRTKIVTESDFSVLIIHQVALTDEGEIKCTATNRAGHVVTRARLKVEAPPKIRLPRQYEDGLIVEAEETLKLKVGIAGQPPPAVIWSHEGETLRTGGRFELETNDTNSALKIAKVKRSDRGEYNIRAVNKLAEDVTSFLVTVTSRPDPPGKVQLSMSFGTSASLTWTSPLDDGGCKIGCYIVEYFRIGWNVWLKAATTRQQSTTLHDLIEGSEYKFRVKAENPYGLSEPSEESDVLFIADPKRGITKPEQKLLPDEGKPPIPPKRKALAPLKFFPDRDIHSAERELPSPSKEKSKNKVSPQIFESDILTREMSYGTPNEVLDIRHSSSFQKAKSCSKNEAPNSEIAKIASLTQSIPQIQNNPPSVSLHLNKRSEVVSNFIPQDPTNTAHEKVVSMTAPKCPALPIKLEHRIPVLSHSNVSKNHRTRPESPKENTDTVELNRENRSPSLNQETDANPKTSSSSVPENCNSRCNRQKDNEHSPSPQTKENRSPSLAADLLPNLKRSPSLQRSQEPVFQSNCPEPLATSEKRSSLPNPTIEISAPQTDPKSHQLSHQISRNGDEVHTSNEFMLVLYPNKKPSRETEKQESFDLDLEEAISPPPISLSSPELFAEFSSISMFQLRRSVSSTELLYERAMARFYEAVEFEKAEESKKLQVSQDQSLKEPSVRRRLGSMSEAERLSFERRNSARRRLSGEISLNMISTMPPKWGSKDNLNIRKSEKSSSSSVQRQSPKRVSPDVAINHIQQSRRSESREFEEDYTDSTASSASLDSMEKFKSEILSRTMSGSSDLDHTYHPRKEPLVMSPYRSPTPDQSSVVLTRPMPPVSPEFVPKPILKRSSTEDVPEKSQDTGSCKFKDISNDKINDKENGNEKAKKKSKSKCVERKDSIGRNLLSFFKKDKSPSDQNLISAAKNEDFLAPERRASSPNVPHIDDQKISPEVELGGQKVDVLLTNTLVSNMIISASAVSIIPATGGLVTDNRSATARNLSRPIDPKQRAEENRRRMLESQRSSEEETKVVVDHYSDIVRELGSSRKSTVPLYLRGDELRQAAEDAQEKEQERSKQDLSVEEELLIERSKAKPRMSIVERIQVQHVQVKSKHAAEKPRREESEGDKEMTDEEESGKKSPTSEEYSGVRGRPLKTVKKGRRQTPSGIRSGDRSESSSIRTRNSSNTRTRDNSSVRTDNQATPNKRTASRSRLRNASKSPGATNRNLLPDLDLIYTKALQEQANSSRTREELIEDTELKVRDSVGYVTDLGLFLVACWVYVFKDARLVLPILILLVYRQLGEAIKDQIPNWMKRKKG